MFDQSRSLDLICMGRVAVDLYAEQIGASLQDAQTFRKYVGGCAGNIAIGSARLGLKTSMLSCVGSDDFGTFVEKTLISEGVDTSYLQRTPNYLTGLVVLGVDPPDNFPLIFFRNDCADLFIDASIVNPSYIASAKALLITGTAFSHAQSAQNTFAIIKLAKKFNTKIILDIDYRPVLWGLTHKGDGEQRFVSSTQVSRVLQEVLPECDLIVGTQEEITIAGGKELIQNLTQAPIVIKKGVDGAEIYFNKENSQLFDAYNVPVLNVLGAGDAFMSGLLSSLLLNKPIKEACLRGNAAGALVVSRHGCAPAMPSLPEVEFFQNNLLIKHPYLEKLHQNITLKNNQRQAPLPIMAFCHRWQLEDSCQEFNQPFSKISEFKTAIAQGVLQACTQNSIKNPTILTDQIYGHEAMLAVKNHDVGIITPIEKSGEPLTQWLEPYSAYEIILKRPPNWGVKLLWQYDFNQPSIEQDHQMAKLQELYNTTSKLERKLMLELIAPNENQVLEIIKQVYENNIMPYWWKLAAFTNQENWQKLTALINQFDSDARVVILGGESKAISSYEQAFSMAKSSNHIIGFAVGRSIFWPAWLKFIKGEYKIKEVQEEIAQKYWLFYQLWLKA